MKKNEKLTENVVTNTMNEIKNGLEKSECKDIGVIKRKRGEWEKDYDFIRENYSALGAIECAKLLHTTPARLSSQAFLLDVKISKINKSNQYSDFDASPFLDIKTPEVAYLLGLIWADGCVSKNDNRIGLDILKKDFLEVQSLFEETGKWKFKSRTPSNRQEIGSARVSNLEFSRFLKENDYLVKSGKSADKILSKVPENLKHYWWRGIFDGDGWFNFKQSKKYCCGLSSCYKQDWNFATKLFESLHISFHISKRKTDRGNSSEICIGNYAGTKTFGDYIYQGKTFGLSRKRIKFQDMQNIKNLSNYGKCKNNRYLS